MLMDLYEYHYNPRLGRNAVYARHTIEGKDEGECFQKILRYEHSFLADYRILNRKQNEAYQKWKRDRASAAASETSEEGGDK